MSEFMNECFTDSHGANVTLGRNYHASTTPRETRAVYLGIFGASTVFDLSVAREIHEHLGAVIADIEAALEAQRPKNSDIIKGLDPGQVFTVKYDGEYATEYFRTAIGYVSRSGTPYPLSDALSLDRPEYTVEV